MDHILSSRVRLYSHNYVCRLSETRSVGCTHCFSARSISNHENDNRLEYEKLQRTGVVMKQCVCTIAAGRVQTRLVKTDMIKDIYPLSARGLQRHNVTIVVP